MTPAVLFAAGRKLSRMIICLALLGMMGGTLGRADDAAAAAEAADQLVRLVVSYGDGVEKHFTQLNWSEGATVLDMLQAAARHPRGIRFQHRGKGPTVLVTRIDDVTNEGGAGTGRNWIYRVNDQVGERSAGIRAVQPGDTILWSFETYR